MRRETLDKILDLLGPDEEAAAAEYCRLHERVSRFFEWNGIDDPEALADEVIDRLGRHVTESETKQHIRNLFGFALGIARLLLLEEFRRQRQKAEASRSWREQRANQHSDAEALDEALEHCLAKMPGDRRKLIKAYYTNERGEKVKQHQRFANEIGITINALRNRALRARQDLEACVRDRLEGKRS